ncbi:hypothetical protein MNB_SV-15-991 [hydrothermal vent metagenome]|uniref:Uncharacterized protein n=1 Tax=hydrothermal vent metagenome TaxID=652676 RepID=A0A1W1EIW0_9ZZZZ
MKLKNILFIVILFTFSLYAELRSSIVAEATSNKVEALELIKVLKSKGFDTKLDKIDSKYLILINLPKDIDKSLLLINRVKQDYPNSFRIFVENNNDDINDIDVFDLIRKNGISSKNIISRYIDAIPPEDRLLWLSLLLFSFIILVIFIIWIIKSYKITKEQKRLQARQKNIERTLSNQKTE